MKKFLATVKVQGPLRTKSTIEINETMVDHRERLTIWNLMELMNQVKSDRCALKTDGKKYTERVKNIELKLYRNANLGDSIAIESSFSPKGKKQVDLKIYVSRKTNGQPMRRVCKAVYTLDIL